MKIAIMQPYFFPYIGYFQLINAVDKFIIYDNIKYTKKGWINRNRYLLNNEPVIFSIPLTHASDYLDIKERTISSSFNKLSLVNKIKAAYTKAPYFQNVFPLFFKIVIYEETNLFKYLYNSIQLLTEYLGIKTQLIISSSIEIDNTLKSQNKVMAICKKLNASSYINSMGGVNLYSKDTFTKNKITLSFMSPNIIKYRQFGDFFVPSLSILDVMMFNSNIQINKMLKDYETI